MSFHSVLVGTGGTDANFLGDIRTALSLGSTGTNTGRRFLPLTRTPKDVWLERQPTEEVSTGAFNKLFLHKYTIHIRIRTGTTGADQSNDTQLAALEADMDTLVRRYRGVRSFTTAFDGTSYVLVAQNAAEGTVDVDPDDQMTMVGQVDVEFLVDHVT